jgi:DNA-binding PadR family transcriptional regulator
MTNAIAGKFYRGKRFFDAEFGNGGGGKASITRNYGATRYSVTRRSLLELRGAMTTANFEEGHEPLTPAMFHVLLALAGDDLHGYAILKEVELRTGGKVRLSTGTLYGIIKRLLHEGLISELRSKPGQASDDERRRYYRLTPRGRELASAEAQRMDEVLAIARARNLLRRPRTT